MQFAVKSNIWKMQVLSFINWFFLIIPTLVIFYQAHGLSMKEVMIIQAVFSIGIVLVEIPSGYFADRFGRKASIVIGAVCGAVGMFFYVIANGFWGFLAAEAILSLGAGFYSGADSALIYDSLLEMGKESEYKKIQGRVSATGNFAEGLASIIGGFLALISLKSPFYAEFCVVLFAIPLAISLREPKPHEPKIMEDKKGMLSITKYALHSHKEIKWLILYSAVIGAATLNIVWFTQPYWKNAGVPLALFGILWALIQFTVGISSMAAHYLDKRLGRGALFASFVFLISFSYVLLGLSKAMWVSIFILVFSIVRGIKGPLISAYINDLIPSYMRATVLSIHQFAGRLVFAIISPFLGWAADLYSINYALLLSAGVFFLCGLVSLVFMRKAVGQQVKYKLV